MANNIVINIYQIECYYSLLWHKKHIWDKEGFLEFQLFIL
jgi:hypothetical protein